MGCSPVIYSGTRSKVLSQKGFVLRDGSVIDNDGQINYIKNGHFEINTTGWINYGSPTGITFSRSTSSPQRGSASLLFQKDAANRTGQGIEYSFTIDSSDKGKVLQCSFEYQISSGTFADNDMAVWIYDVTNAVLIQPAPYLIKNSGIIEKFAVEFQTAINSTSYKLILLCNSTSNLSYDLKFDNIVLGPQAKLYGSAVTDWVSYSPNMSSPGILTNSGRWRRIGDTMEVECYIEWNGSGGGGGLLLDIPAGFSIDTAKLSLSTGSKLGEAERLDSGVAYYGVSVVFSDSNSVRFMQTSGSAYLAGSDFTAGDQLKANFRVPIQGWSSSQVFSSDADVRVVIFSGYVASNQALTANVTNLPLTSSKDSHAAWTGSTYVVPVPGDYQLAATLLANATGGTMQAYVNAAAVKQMMTINTTEYVSSALTLENLKAGDIISFRSNATQTVAGVSTAFVSISRISGPSQIAASESVAALYTGAPPTGTFNSSFNTVTYGTKVKDSHNAYSGGVYTIPTSGVYDISAQLLTLTTLTANQLVQLGVSINGAAPTYKAHYNATAAASSALVPFNIKSIPLLAGQTVAIQALTEGTTNSLSSTAGNSYFSITRTGNY